MSWQFLQQVLAGIGGYHIAHAVCVCLRWWTGIHWGSRNSSHPGWWTFRETAPDIEWRKIGKRTRQ